MGKKKVVLTVDFSVSDRRGIEFVKNNFGEGYEVVLLHVIDDEGFSNPPVMAEEMEEFEKLKRKQLVEMADQISFAARPVLLRGNVSKSIADYNAKCDPEVVVVGARKSTFFLDRLINRNIRNEIINNSSCPVVCC